MPRPTGRTRDRPPKGAARRRPATAPHRRPGTGSRAHAAPSRTRGHAGAPEAARSPWSDPASRGRRRLRPRRRRACARYAGPPSFRRPPPRRRRRARYPRTARTMQQPSDSAATGRDSAASRRSNTGASHSVSTSPRGEPSRARPKVASSAPICALSTGRSAAKLPKTRPMATKPRAGRAEMRRAERTAMARSATARHGPQAGDQARCRAAPICVFPSFPISPICAASSGPTPLEAAPTDMENCNGW
jgi:hypothetical protein